MTVRVTALDFLFLSRPMILKLKTWLLSPAVTGKFKVAVSLSQFTSTVLVAVRELEYVMRIEVLLLQEPEANK